jgi:hypothetical protein
MVAMRRASAIAAGRTTGVARFRTIKVSDTIPA